MLTPSKIEFSPAPAICAAVDAPSYRSRPAADLSTLGRKIDAVFSAVKYKVINTGGMGADACSSLCRETTLNTVLDTVTPWHLLPLCHSVAILLRPDLQECCRRAKVHWPNQPTCDPTCGSNKNRAYTLAAFPEIMEVESAVSIPQQHTQPEVVDFRNAAHGPRGYKCANKRKLDEYEEQVCQ